MTYQEVMTAIKQGKLQHIYLISGEESYLASKIERALLKQLLPSGSDDGIQVYSNDVAIDDLINSINSTPFFAERNVIIARNPAFFKEHKKAGKTTGSNDKQDIKLESIFSNMPEYSFLILRTDDKIDKRRKIYKVITKHGCAVEVMPIRPWEVKDWLQVKLKEIDRRFDRDAYNYFLEITSVMNTVSVGFLEQEVDKLALYSDKKIITKNDLLRVMASLPEVSIFSMLDAISDRNVSKALQLLLEQITGGIHQLRIITMLSRHVRQIWQAKLAGQMGINGKNLASEIGVVPFIAEKLLVKSRFFAEDTLKTAQIALADADYQFKSGQADVAVLERIIINLCG